MHIVKSVQRPLVHMMDGVHRRTMVWRSGEHVVLEHNLSLSSGRCVMYATAEAPTDWSILPRVYLPSWDRR